MSLLKEVDAVCRYAKTMPLSENVTLPEHPGIRFDRHYHLTVEREVTDEDSAEIIWLLRDDRAMQGYTPTTYYWALSLSSKGGRGGNGHRIGRHCLTHFNYIDGSFSLYSWFEIP